jgi:transposase
MQVQVQVQVQLQSRAPSRKPYPSDVSDEEWAFVAPYLTLCREDAPQRRHELREVFNAVRWMVKTGTQWRYMPNHFPSWAAVYQQTHRWMAAGVFAALVHDLRVLLRLGDKRAPDPTAVIIDARTLRSTPENGHRAGYDGHKRTKGSKLHLVVDTLGHLLTLTVTPANEQERAQVAELAIDVQALTSGEVELAFVDHGYHGYHGYTGDEPALAAAEHGIVLGGDQAPGGEEGLRAPPPTVGRRTERRLVDALPTPRARLRAAPRDRGRLALPRFRVPHALESHQTVRKFITASRKIESSSPQHNTMPRKL